MNKLLTWALAVILCPIVFKAEAQNKNNNMAVAGGIVIRTKGNYTKMSIVYNPDKNVYYSLEGGTSLATVITYSDKGERIDSTSTGFDYRGAWWNKSTHQLEGNGFKGSGIVSGNVNQAKDPAAKKYNALFTQNAQPADQSKAAFDTLNNQIVYYYAGNIYRYSKNNYAALPVLAVKNLPVTVDNLSPYTIVATGEKGKEYGVLDVNNKKVYFLNTAGEYAGTSTLPANAPTIDIYGASYCNGYLWLYDNSSYSWSNYQIINNNPVSETAPVITASQGSTAFTAINKNSVATLVDANITVTADDQSTLQKAEIQITGNAGEGDALSFQNNNSTMGNITGSYSDHTLTLTGNADLNQWQAALRAVKFNNTSSSPSLASRTISYTVYNGSLTSNVSTKGIDIKVPRGFEAQGTATADSSTNNLAEIKVHTALSPNGDGINDRLEIDGIEKYTNNKMVIVNRNGVTVAQINGYDNNTNAFDGHSTITHQLQQQGTYFYMIEYVANGQAKRQSGYFLLKY